MMSVIFLLPILGGKCLDTLSSGCHFDIFLGGRSISGNVICISSFFIKVFTFENLVFLEELSVIL